MSSQLAWHVARASGLVAWALATASVLGGFALSGRVFGRRLAPAWLTDVHRMLGGLTVVFTAVHVVALIADDYVDFSLTDVLVPFAAQWRPGPVAWGVTAMYLALAVELSSLLRRRLPPVWWRRLHLLSVPLYGTATLHLLTAGTDAGHPAVRVAAIGSAALFVTFAVFRVLIRPPRRPRQPRQRGAAGRPAPRSPQPPAAAPLERSR